MTKSNYMSWATTLYPASIRLFAIWKPMFPSPMNPTCCNQSREIIGYDNIMSSKELTQTKKYQPKQRKYNIFFGKNIQALTANIHIQISQGPFSSKHSGVDSKMTGDSLSPRGNILFRDLSVIILKSSWSPTSWHFRMMVFCLHPRMLHDFLSSFWLKLQKG